MEGEKVEEKRWKGRRLKRKDVRVEDGREKMEV